MRTSNTSQYYSTMEKFPMLLRKSHGIILHYLESQLQKCTLGVPYWLSGLRIWHSHFCGSGCCCGTGLITGPRTSTCYEGGQKTKTKKKNGFLLVFLLSWSHSPLSFTLAPGDCLSHRPPAHKSLSWVLHGGPRMRWLQMNKNRVFSNGLEVHFLQD